MYMRELSRHVECNFDSPVVSVSQGILRGMIVEGTYIFRGVPYAQSKRFSAPSVQERWEGVRAAENFGPVCRTLYIPPMPDNDRVPRYYYPESETCQFLNIWTPSLESKMKKPVLVWLSGYGWVSGSSMELVAADGENLAGGQDIVVVGVNHRHQALGCLDLSAFGETYKDTSLVGLLDIISALNWIKENIAAFGGDPNNVTLVGHGGGAEKVIAVMQSPEADGLYHKVILESGGTCGVAETPGQARREAKAFTGLVLQRLGLEHGSVQEIGSLDWYDLATGVLEAMRLYEEKYGHAYRFRPIPDGERYLGHPLQVGFREETKNIPMMIGHCSGEKKDDTPLLECRIRQADAPVWKWLFALEAPFMNGTTPWHGSEIAYVFQNAAYIEAQYDPGISEAVERVVSGAWAAFARYGNPNHSNMPQWCPVTKEHFSMMVFDKECHVAVERDHLAVRSCVWDETYDNGILPGIQIKVREG